MTRTMQQTLVGLEVKNLHPLRMAKKHVGDAVTAAIGTEPRKRYGHEGRLSEVCAGEKVPDWLARIYQDDDARIRFGLDWLRGMGPRVRVRMTVDIDDK